MTRLDAFILTSTLLVFFSLIEVLVTTILDNNQQTERARKIDRYSRVIFPVIFHHRLDRDLCEAARVIQD
jgi:cadmium resistance protein CadD (predicted permease)